MSVNLSPFAGAGWQFFSDAGFPLSGGKIYTYAAGTSTPITSYTSNTGLIQNSNPIVLDAVGRTTNQVWLTAGSAYKFVLADSSNNIIGTYDYISGINDFTNLLSELANTSNVALGDALIGFKQSNSSGALVGAVGRTVHQKFQNYVDVRDFGAVGDGVNDDTAAIQAAIDASNNVWFGQGTWTINDTIEIPAGRYLDLGPGNILASCGANPIFSFGSSSGGAEGLSIYGAGGLIEGTADSFLKLEGTSNWGISPYNFARQIRLEGLHVTDPNINKFLHMVTAVRQLFVSKCQTYTPNGVLANGKCVEIMFDKCIIFSSSGAAGTYNFKLSSSLGSNYYNEGWTISDSTIDAAEYAFDIADIFVFEVDNSYIGRPTIIRRPVSTTHTREIIFDGNVIYADITFASSAVGLLSYALIANNIFVNGFIAIQNNHAQISIRGNKFESSSSGVAVSIGNNCNNITCENLDMDATYIGGIIMSGANGGEITIRNISYAGTGSSLFQSRPALVNNIDLGDGTSLGTKQVTDFVNGTYAVGAIIGSVVGSWGKGQTGKIVGVISATGLDAGVTLGVPNQRWDIATPTNFELPAAPGNSAGYFYPLAASGMFGFCIPFYCTADIAGGTVSITNATGNTIDVPFHSWFGVVND